MKKVVGCFLCMMLMTFGAQAHALLITPLSEIQWSGDENNQNDINDAIAGIIGDADLLYKNDVGTGESGVLAGSYETEFLNSPTDPSGANITYIGGPIADIPAFLLVKDGSQEPAWYLFVLQLEGEAGVDELEWNGTETLELANFWPNQGAISHVTLYGRSVPEPATMFLLGTGLICMAGIGRKKFFK